MYTQGMTPLEIKNETFAEVDNLLAKLGHLMPKFRRQVMKCSQFPMVVRYEQRTARKNRWLVTLTAENRRSYDGRERMHAYCISESQGGKYVYSFAITTFFGKKGKECDVYKPHFFKRYTERLKLDLHGESLINHFFDQFEERIIHFVKMPNGEERIIACFPEGLAFGNSYLERRVVIFRTFVAKHLLVGEQVYEHLSMEAMLLENDDKS